MSLVSTETASSPAPSDRVRKGIRVRGVVQGVGFRPAVYRLAERERLAGFVRNDAEGVWIEIEGSRVCTDRFARALLGSAPSLSRIESVDVRDLALTGEREFRIETSSARDTGALSIPVDTATCDACLREMFDRRDRRYRYPFINCTECGPRFTIVTNVPWDRQRTTMADFPLCDACRSEYEDPSSRRFHAEAIACPECGPRLSRPIEEAIEALRRGAIVAIKGIGGFHLIVDAENDDAVRRLREMKRRPHRPLALMGRDLATVEQIAFVDDTAHAALTHASRPIVLLPKRSALVAIAPGLNEIGVMLPYAPLHHLLLEQMPLLVMTSANRTSEPIAIDNDAAIGIADVLLAHDRPIASRADDSVVRIVAGAPQPVRRARGLIPEPLPLPFHAPDLLAVGAELKNTICIARDGSAWLSQHIGDVSNLATRSAFEETIRDLSRLVGATPVAVAHDLHPDYDSTRWALQSGLRRIGVQHHHAHIASCLAEHGRTGPVIGVAFDGTGCGPAGDLWGGEFLVADLNGFRRPGHLQPIALAGGEAAIRQPWRVALAALIAAGEPPDLMDNEHVKQVEQMIRRGTRTVTTSSAGRWFDAVAALCGVRDEITYEAQAAMELEAIATPGAEPLPFTIRRHPEAAKRGEGSHDAQRSPLRPFAVSAAQGDVSFMISLDDAVRAIARDLRAGATAAEVASRFHETMAQIVVAGVLEIADAERPPVALSGGCFQNRILTERARDLLEQHDFEVLIHRRVPPNDGGVALGQAAVAASRLAAEKER